MLGVRQWRHVALRHGAFCVSRQHRHFYVLFIKGWCVYSSMKQCLQSLNYEQFPIQMTKNNKWLEILDFQPKLVWRTSTEIHRLRRRRRQQVAAGKAQRTSLSTAKATSSTQRPQTCTEVATKYYNYTANGADEEREHRPPTLQKAEKAMGRWQATLTVYSKIIFFDATIGSNSGSCLLCRPRYRSK